MTIQNAIINEKFEMIRFENTTIIVQMENDIFVPTLQISSNTAVSVLHIFTISSNPLNHHDAIIPVPTDDYDEENPLTK